MVINSFYPYLIRHVMSISESFKVIHVRHLRKQRIVLEWRQTCVRFRPIFDVKLACLLHIENIN